MIYDKKAHDGREKFSCERKIGVWIKSLVFKCVFFYLSFNATIDINTCMQSLWHFFPFFIPPTTFSTHLFTPSLLQTANMTKKNNNTCIHKEKAFTNSLALAFVPSEESIIFFVSFLIFYWFFMHRTFHKITRKKN